MFDGILSAITQPVASLVGSGLGFVGQNQANQKNWDIAQASNEVTRQLQEDSQTFNADQARIDREFQASQISSQQAYNASEAQKARDYATQMANTSYQRAVGDLKAAGLNPMLAYTNGGATTPNAAAANAGAASGSRASSGQGSASSVAPMLNSFNAFQNSANAIADLMNKAEQNQLLKAQTNESDERANLTRAQYFNELDLNPYVKKKVDYLLAQIGLTQSQQRLTSAQTADVYQNIGIKAPEAEKATNAWGRFVAPYLKDVGNLGGAIRSFTK